MGRDDLTAEDLWALIALKDEALAKQGNIVFDLPVQHRAAQRALEATPADAESRAHRLEQMAERSHREAMEYLMAYERLQRETAILRAGLHRKLERAERAFKEANRQRRELQRAVAEYEKDWVAEHQEHTK
jgi:hypothetical protein